MNDAKTLDRLTIKFETVTVEKATEWLQNNGGNRRQKETTVDAYAREMLSGKWRLTHQGIAFDDGGRLLDGQHRLCAVLKARVPVQMLVMRGFPSTADQDGVQMIDVVDRGVLRSVADQLKITHGITSPNQVSAAVNILTVIALRNGQSKRITIPQILQLANWWKDTMPLYIAGPEAMKQFRVGLVAGCFSFAAVSRPKLIRSAWEALLSGAGLSTKDPILHLRNWLLSDGSSKAKAGGGTGRYHGVCAVLNYLHAACESLPSSAKIQTEEKGLVYFSRGQEATIKSVELLFLTMAPQQPAPSDYAKSLVSSKEFSDRIYKKLPSNK